MWEIVRICEPKLFFLLIVIVTSTCLGYFLGKKKTTTFSSILKQGQEQGKLKAALNALALEVEKRGLQCA